MILTLLRDLIFCVFVLFIAAPVVCQDGPDAWEKRHNEYQPLEKVMAAMGIKPGMIIGESWRRPWSVCRTDGEQGWRNG